ncbi:MAG: transporter substrate-binding domain-containing protein [Holosporales bacterium]|jgi:polar amino acid transport system substrate-binding protein|nr:transporter substrate-binding domain-containing protein [Holosporales bacterium]
MKKFLRSLFAVAFCLISASNAAVRDTISIGTCADFPPFEFFKDGQLTGFDVELIKLIAAKIGRKVEFKDMPFGSLIVSIQTGAIDCIISGLNISEEKKKIVDFSKEYYTAKMALVYRNDNPVISLEQVAKKKVACQLGTSGHEKKIKEAAPEADIQLMDTFNQAIEALKAGHVDCVFMDEAPSKEFCSKNPELGYNIAAEYDEGGYAIAVVKGSTLLEPINKALEDPQLKEEIEKLKLKYGI